MLLDTSSQAEPQEGDGIMRRPRLTTAAALVAPTLTVLIVGGALALAACGNKAPTTTGSSSPTSAPAVATTESGSPPPTATGPGTIAFVKVTENGRDIYTIHSDGTRLRRLTNTAADEDLARWSPDGKRIAFVRFIGGPDDENTTIWVMKADGSHQRRITSDAVRGYLGAWSPDGRRLVFSRCQAHYEGYDLAVMNADGSRLRRVTHHPATTVSDTCWGPTWAPDGRIFFVEPGKTIRSVNPDGSDLRDVTWLAEDSFSVSPDSKWLLFWEPQKDRLTLIRTDGQGAEVGLLEEVSRYIPSGAPPATSWSPDGQAIAFAADSSTDEGPSSLFVLSADGSLKKLPNAGRVFNPVWRPQ
jgi:Tol biopolymer transport system component